MKEQQEDRTARDWLAVEVVRKMMKDDLFSQWLGIQVIDIREGYSLIRMTIRDEMVNGFGVIHGGIAFSLADSAFAFACNNRNNLSLALDVSITFNKALKPGDVITAEAKELHNGRSTGLYLITVLNEQNEQVALFKGTCFRTGKTLINPE
jgi:acyl-CoA thioesterase